jgi:hypothetical protein
MQDRAMLNAQFDAQLNALPQRVWDFVTAIGFWPRWMEGVVAVEPADAAPIGLNTRFTIRRASQRAGREGWLVRTWQPARRVDFVSYTHHIDLRFTLDPHADHTTLRAAISYPNTRGPLGRLLPDMRRAAELGRSLHTLQQMIAFNRDIWLLHGVGDE